MLKTIRLGSLVLTGLLLLSRTGAEVLAQVAPAAASQEAAERYQLPPDVAAAYRMYMDLQHRDRELIRKDLDDFALNNPDSPLLAGIYTLIGSMYTYNTAGEREQIDKEVANKYYQKAHDLYGEKWSVQSNIAWSSLASGGASPATKVAYFKWCERLAKSATAEDIYPLQSIEILAQGKHPLRIEAQSVESTARFLKGSNAEQTPHIAEVLVGQGRRAEVEEIIRLAPGTELAAVAQKRLDDLKEAEAQEAWLTKLFASSCNGADWQTSRTLARATSYDGIQIPAFNQVVLEVLSEYPQDGTHDYFWPKGDDPVQYDGATADMLFKGKVVMKGEPKKRTYCCGITLEVFLKSYERWTKTHGEPPEAKLTPESWAKFQRLWFVEKPNGPGPSAALEEYGLGRTVPFRDTLPGDFVQLWREPKEGKTVGSGHSVIFLHWLKNEKGEITGMRYWSSNPSTDGISRRDEYLTVAAHDGGLKESVCHVGRVEVPIGK